MSNVAFTWLRTFHLSEPPLAGSQPGVDALNVKVLNIHNAVGMTWNDLEYVFLTDWHGQIELCGHNCHQSNMSNWSF